MPTGYDADILQTYADDLYKQARYIVITTTIRYGLLTFLVLTVLSAILSTYISRGPRATDEGSSLVLAVLIITLIGIAVGISEGRKKAFELKLKAQQLLCQRQIEINTRSLNASRG